MKYYKYIYFTLIALVITDSLRYIGWSGKLDIPGATSIAVILNYISLAIMIFLSTEIKWNYEVPQPIRIMFTLWMINNVFNLFRAVFLASDYWEWKIIFTTSESFSLIPLVFFLGINLEIAKTVFTFCLKYLFPFGFVLIPLTFITNDELYSRIMIPIVLFILVIPYIKSQWKILLIVVTITSIAMNIGFRSNLIKSTSSALLLLIFYFQDYIRLSWIRLARWFFFIIPIVLLALALTGTYNLFDEISQDDKYEFTDDSGNQQSLTADTRTFLYEEVITSVIKSDALWFGKSAIGSYTSEFFTDLTGTSESNKRFGCEVGILNFFMRYGIVGVSIYLLLLLTVSYYAINRSNNTLAKMIGLFIAFRWTYAFIEEFTQYDLNFYFFWFAVGLVSSTSFRKMNDNELKIYLGSL